MLLSYNAQGSCHDTELLSPKCHSARLRNPDLKRTCIFLLKYQVWRKAWVLFLEQETRCLFPDLLGKPNLVHGW